MYSDLLEQLLNEEEGSYLDFKQEQYRFEGADNREKSEVLKDILAFTNAWRRTDAYILIGVEEVTTTDPATGETVTKKIASDDQAISVKNSADAEIAITEINHAIESVSDERSKFGALQNRLEHTINNLRVSSENLQAAESRIRDTDMADQMVSLSKDKIISQSGQAMLAQANAAPQGVLQLLQG